MRLVYIANANSIHTRRWIEPFIRRGDEVHLLSYMRVERSWPDVTLVDMTRLPGPPKGKLYNWARWLRGYLRRIRPDILHAHQVTIAGWLGALTGFHPYVISAWGSDLLVAPTQSLREKWKIQFALRRCDRLTTPSPLMYNAALALGMPENRLYLIPWGVETNIFKPEPDDRSITRDDLGLSQDVRVILCPRGLKPIYNHDITIKAVAETARDLEDLALCFLNFSVDEAYKARLQTLITDMGLEKTVHWLPAQKDIAAMARVYRMADVMVSIPSSEGYGFSVYEALACGVPAIISDLPIFAGTLEDGEHVLKAGVRDSAGTAQALTRLVKDAPLRQHLQENGVQLTKRMSVAQRIKRTDDLYHSLLIAAEPMTPKNI